MFVTVQRSFEAVPHIKPPPGVHAMYMFSKDCVACQAHDKKRFCRDHSIRAAVPFCVDSKITRTLAVQQGVSKLPAYMFMPSKKIVYPTV